MCYDVVVVGVLVSMPHNRRDHLTRSTENFKLSKKMKLGLGTLSRVDSVDSIARTANENIKFCRHGPEGH